MRTFTKLTTTTLFGALVGLSACHSDLDGKAAAVVEAAPPQGATNEASTAAAHTLALDPSSSGIEFVGAKVTGDHRGRFDNPTGKLELDADGGIVGMEVLIDTQSVNIEPDKLEQHLRSPDFFDVEKYPKARFQLTAITGSSGDGTGYQVTGDLELRGVTKRITFPATAHISDGSVSADASFKINRKDFGILYAGMADDLIKDEVLLEMKLEFRAAAAERR